MTVFFHNKEPIDLNAIALMGVSVKTGDNPIGYFGTGLKFAIATLLRTGHKIHLHANGECIKFTAIKKIIRGEDFEVVCMNDTELGFTTRLGRNWEPWQAYRELYCNCTDEGGVIGTEIPHGDWGTAFAVDGEAFENCHKKRDEIFLLSKPVFTTASADMHNGSGNVGFYRGVRAHAYNATSLFTYNVKTDLELTEDRTVKQSWWWEHHVEKMVLTIEDEDVLEKILLAPQGTLEHNFDLDQQIVPSKAFMNVAFRLRSNVHCNHSALKTWERNAEVKHVHTEVEIDAFEERQLQDAMTLVQRLGCDIGRQDFMIVDGMGEGVFGAVRNNQILISKRAFDLGARFVASTLYEEWLHKNHQYKDCSRDLQNLLFEKLFSMVERVVGMDAHTPHTPASELVG